jgi:ABC-type transport system substrate-binding protein
MSAVVGDWLKAAGFDTQQMTIPAAQAQDNQLRSVFPGVLVVSSNSGDAALQLLSSASIPSASNRWVGINRGGWSSPDYDRFLTAFSTSLDRGERVGLMRQMLRLYSEEVPLVSIAFSVGDDAVVSAVKGPATVAPESNMAWNIHTWELQ